MKIDLSLTITAIIALSAIISPIITSILNNRHQSKIKKLEMYELAKRNALEEYIEALYSSNHSGDNANQWALYKALNKLYLYFPSLTDKEYETLEDSCGKPSERSQSVYKTIQSLSMQIKKK